MKTRPLLLGLSLVANLALAAVLLRRGAPPVASPPPVPTPAAAPAGPLAPGADTWAKLDAENDAEFVARLRAEGFPPNMMFALVNLRLQQRHAEELKRFRPRADYAYWRQSFSQVYQDPLSPEDRAARRALDRRIADERRQLLGPESDPASLNDRANRKRTYGDLPAEKAEQVSAILRDYNEVAALIRDRAKGVTLPEDREQLALIEKEKRADLAGLLTPQELMEYDLRASPSAMTVRGKLRNFDATEEEYRALTHLQLAFDAEYGGTNLSAEQQARRTEATAELTAQIKSLLPPERFAEYEIKTDPTYMNAAMLASQFSLPPETADSLVRAQRDLAPRFNALRNNRDLPADARNAQLDALSSEATAKLAALLGDDAFAYFKRNGGPINALLNRPARKP